MSPMLVVSDPRTFRRVVTAGIVLGAGMGGFVDGILFHQVLQLHSMLSGHIPRDSIAHLEVNMLWDGLFHAMTWIMTAIGIGMLWRAATEVVRLPPLGTFVGALLVGWGAFNFIEGVIDHELLGVHHVVENGPHLGPDLAFLASGLVLLAIGWRLLGIRSAAPLAHGEAHPR